MSPEVSEKSFEDAIECGLLQHGPDACAGDVTAVRETPPPYGDTPPGGYRRRRPDDYDRSLCLLARDVVDFVLATQPKEWKKLEQHHGAAVKEQFLRRLASEVERRGTLDVLRHRIKDSGCKFRLAYFRPASGLNDETRRLHAANLFSVVRQLRYSQKDEKKSLALLHTMYVDKKLGGVNAVQTLSRLNRTHPEKRGTLVLDFANEADEIQAAFEPYYETTLLSEATDPNLLYKIQSRLVGFPVYTDADVERFATVYYKPKAAQDQLYAALAPVVERFRTLAEEEQHDFRGQLTDYVRLYAFLAQVLTFADPDLEKLYAFARHLRRLLPADGAELPRDVQQNIDMESYRIQQTGSGQIGLEHRTGVLDPMGTKDHYGTAPEELESLSRIIAELNERFGLNLGSEQRITLGQMMERLDADPALDASARVNTRENVRLTFDQKVEHVISVCPQTSECRGATQAAGIEDPRVQIDAAVWRGWEPPPRKGTHAGSLQDDRRISQHGRWRPPDRNRGRPAYRGH